MKDENAQLARLCENLGAGRRQAEVMAAQLLKRAEQLSLEREISRSEALEHLLRVLVQGRRGEIDCADDKE